MRINFAVSLLVCLAAAVPATSATKRAVQTLPTAPFTDTIIDAVSGNPVIGAEVRNGTEVALTDAKGIFTIRLTSGRPTILTIHRTGYDDTTFGPFVPAPESTIPVNATVPIAVQPRPPVLVQLTSGQTVHVDADSVQFAQITGPATSVTSSACCKLGPTLAIDVKMKNGDAAKVTFADACYGYDIDFVGRDHDSAQYVYFNFKDVALITFP